MPTELRDIVTEKFQTEIQDSFAHATGFGIVFVDRAGKHIGKGSNFCQFCIALNEKEKTRKLCELSNRKGISIALSEKKPSIYRCHAELVSIVIPLICDGDYLGAITAGQVLCDETDYYPKVIAGHSRITPTAPEYTRYLREIKVLTRQQIEATTVALRNISVYIMQTVTYSRAQQELILYEKRRIELEHRLKLAELDALQKQVTPHFIFNVINSISRLLSFKRYDIAEKMLNSFAQMMRYTLRNIRAEVSLGQELDYIQNYLTIQQVRFETRIRYHIECPDCMKSMRIPFFSLQPLVENAIEHGLLKREKGGELLLRCSVDRTGSEILLTDNGVGIDDMRLAKIKENLQRSFPPLSVEHVGLYNSYHRLWYLYQEHLSFSIESELGRGTAIRIHVAKPQGAEWAYGNAD